MEHLEFFHRAMIAALPEAVRHCRSKGKAAVAKHAREQAEELCLVAELVAELVPTSRPTTAKLGRSQSRTGKK